MSLADFVHLRVHTAYSLSEGAIHVRELVELCLKEAMPAVAMTDRNNMFGALEFSNLMADAGIQPIIGVTLAVKAEPDDPTHVRPPPPDWLVLLAQTPEGYGNLLKIVSRAHLGVGSHESPHVRLDSLAGATQGLIALGAGTDGIIGHRLLARRIDAAREGLLSLKALFPDRLYMDIARHGEDAEREIEGALLDLAYDHDVPLVATNQPFFARASQFEAHDALLCIAASTVLADPERRRLNPEYYFKSAREMRRLFRDLPEAVDNSLVIAQRCAVKAEKRAPILPNFTAGKGVSEADLLREEAHKGLAARLARAREGEALSEEAAKPYWQRLDYELDVIIDMGFAGYFLIVADFIGWAKGQGIPVGPGRGSGAGSVVAWALLITDLDPLRFNLLFERFLNPERVSMPDFDIDFCQDRRDEVIRYVQQKYGRDQVAQIVTFGRLQARNVLRDVGRVMGLGYGDVDRLAKLVPNNPANPVTLSQAIAGEPRLEAARRDPEIKQLFDIALQLEGLFRHTGTHAAGVVIGDRPLDELVPLYRDPRSAMPVTQFDMKRVEEAGLVKFDFLGLKTLTVLKTAVKLLAERGVAIDLDHLPLDDAPTYAMLSRGESFGVFQLESEGMRGALTALKPDKLEDIIALVALYRPGPMDNIPQFVNRKHGREAIDCLHPWLKDILGETYGVIIYQEQVMQIAQVLAGYSLGEADLLRRAMGKKRKEEMDAQRARFIEGAAQKGVDAGQASFIFDLVAKFAGYGFNKSHAAAYALVAYQTAYLKANFPVAFLAASMTLDMHNTDKLAGFVGEARRLGIPVLAPDVNASEAAFAVEDEGRAIRYALAAVKNVGHAAMEALVAERRRNGVFSTLYDLGERLDPTVLNKRMLENLIRAGALDGLNANRAQSLAATDIVLKASHDAAARKASAQVSLFGAAEMAATLPPLPQVDGWDPLKSLEEERAAIGFYLSAHPLDAYRPLLEARGVVPAATAIAGDGPRAAMLAGVIEGLAERKAKSGTPFVSLALSDGSGPYEVTFFRELMADARRLHLAGAPVLITVAVEKMAGSDRVNLTAKAIVSLEEAAAQAVKGVRIFLTHAGPVAALQALLAANRGGRGRVSLNLLLGDGREVEIEVPGGYKITPEVRGALAGVDGVTQAVLL
ncbi:MAG: DNA polymerase III subunit alpha [Pseudomonadota bacterium]